MSCFRSLLTPVWNLSNQARNPHNHRRSNMAATNSFTSSSISCGASLTVSVNAIATCPRSVVAVRPSSSSCMRPARCAVVGIAAPVAATAEGDERRFEQLAVPPELVDELVEEALVWCSQHGLVVGDKNHPRSGKAPGVGLLHAPFALLPMSFPKIYWEQALELAPLFNELVHRVSLDGDFLQQTLARTKEVDPFTRRLLDIHSKMMELNKKEDIQLALTRSDYMVDGATDKLLQVELNTISTSSNGLACGVSELHRNLIRHHERELDLDPASVVGNTAITQHAEALAAAWAEYNNQSAVVLVVVQAEERYMYDQYWITVALREMYGVTTIRKTMAEIEAEGDLRPDGTLMINGRPVAVVYFRAGYSPADYPSEAEWRARLWIERSSAIKCPSIAHHLVGTKKIQQELAKEKVLERFLDNKSDIENVRKCFAGLWSLENDSIVNSAIESPELFVLKPQREGGGNNIYGDNLREMLIRLRKDGSNEIAAYVLMQRIFPPASPSYLVREGTFVRDNVVSEFGIFGAYLRNKDKVIINDQCGYLLRTKAASLNEGGVVAAPEPTPHAHLLPLLTPPPPPQDRNRRLPSASAAAMSPSLLGGLTKSLAMTVLSEVGDKTFFAAAILAMRHPRKLVLAGCLSALTVMTALSASLGWVAPNLISRKWTHHITTLLFFVFGIWSLWEGFKEEGESEDLAELEAKLDADFKSNKGDSKNKSKATEDTKKKQRPFLMQFFSPIFIKAFSITFFGEWGDKSQIATIGLAADENPFGVVIGGVIAQALCTTAAVMGGKSLASQISEKMVELSSGVLFLLFGIMSLLSGPEGQL